MTESALTEALRREAADGVELLWRQARADAEAVEAAEAKSMAALADDLAAVRDRRVIELERTTIADATREVRRIRAAATGELAMRLRILASALLSRFRAEHYDRLFAALVDELPRRSWDRVRVNPADQPLAARFCPGARIDVDPSVVAGLDVSADEGRVGVSNTMETRLSAAWPDVLPELVTHVVAEIDRA